MSDQPITSTTPYDSGFFHQLRQGSYQSAHVIIPMMLDWCHPQHVVDVGCGDGTWLSVFRDYGVEDILGIDGDYVDRSELQIPSECFVAKNLRQPLILDRTFDLVVSLEVAEHLPNSCANSFITSLVNLGDVILFSAAIPHQGGRFHVNEQWPSYWIERFEANGYVAIDALRSLIWDHPQVEPWYAQNCLIFVKGDRLTDYPSLQAQVTAQPPRALVHPKLYLQKCPPLVPRTKDIEIIAVALPPSPALEVGDTLAFAIDLQWHTSQATAQLSISLTNADARLYFKMEKTLHHTPKTDPQMSVQTEIEHLNLAPGNYFVDIAVYASDEPVIYDSHWHLYPITVTGISAQDA